LKAGNKSSNVNKYQFWRHDNKPIELWSNKVIDEKIDYLPAVGWYSQQSSWRRICF